MRNFTYRRATALEAAIAAVAGQPDSRFLAGGTTLVDLMKCDVERPSTLVDIMRLPDLDRIDATPDGLRIGALATMSTVADHHAVREGYPAIAEALLLGASMQLRNMATIGGNLLQRTRCAYFRDPAYVMCNKRAPGSGCAAMTGENRMHAILGTSEHCIATYPGDLAVALVAFDAAVNVAGAGGRRTVPLDSFHREPGDTPDVETVLRPGELIVSVDVPASAAARRSMYLKVRDRESYDFAAASAAVGLALEDGIVRDARVALGGVATRPWRARGVEALLIGHALDEMGIRAAADAATEGAVPRGQNAFKIELTRRTVARALMRVGGLA